METFNAFPEYYNLAGEYTKSKKEFKRHMKRELIFYEKLHEQAIEKGDYGIKIKPDKTNKIFGLDKFDLY